MNQSLKNHGVVILTSHRLSLRYGEGQPHQDPPCDEFTPSDVVEKYSQEVKEGTKLITTSSSKFSLQKRMPHPDAFGGEKILRSHIL